MKKYEGKEPCPGCGRTGEQVARDSRNGLCYDCQKKLRLGESLVKERGMERNYYKMDDLVAANMTWYVVSIREIDRALRRLFSTLSQFNLDQAIWLSGIDSYLGHQADAVTAHDTFIMPRVTFEAAQELCDAIKEVSQKLRKEECEYRKRLEKEVAEMKNDIYNDGVEHGRNLLFQLNNGEISLEDFSKRIKKF